MRIKSYEKEMSLWRLYMVDRDVRKSKRDLMEQDSSPRYMYEKEWEIPSGAKKLIVLSEDKKKGKVGYFETNSCIYSYSL